MVCPSQTQCYAVGSGSYVPGPGWIVASSDAGDTWKLLDSVSQGDSFSAIACPTATHCIAVGERSTGQGATASDVALVVVTADTGEHWANAPVPSSVGVPLDVACASITTCVVVGGAVIRTSDGGTSWEPVSTPAGLAGIDSVACPTATFCIIGGSGPGPEASSPSMSSISDDGGLTWSTATIAGGPSGLGEISCSDAQTCVGLVGSGATNTFGMGSPIVTSDGGTTWTAGSSEVGAAVSCLSSFCVSVGGLWQSATNTYPGDAFVSTDGGLNWTPMTITTSQSLTSVACTSTVSCVAVGGSFPDSRIGVIMTYGS